MCPLSFSRPIWRPGRRLDAGPYISALETVLVSLGCDLSRDANNGGNSSAFGRILTREGVAVQWLIPTQLVENRVEIRLNHLFVAETEVNDSRSELLGL